MNIGIDTFGCDHGRSGLGSYLYYLIESLPVEENLKYSLFGSELDRYTYNSVKQNDFINVDINDSLHSEIFWHRMKAKKFFKDKKFDAVLFAAASRMLPSSFKVPGIAIINEVVSSTFESFSEKVKKAVLLKSLEKINKIIASSLYIKSDLVNCGIDSNKITVIPNGIDHSRFYQHAAITEDYVDVKPFAIKRPYIIYPSRISGPSKKHIELIKAFSEFKNRTKLPHRLVLAGIEDSWADKVHKEALKSSVASEIFITGFFPHDDFSLLYAGADACVFPSVSEGVALPVLEAMASGIPVACSSSGVLPEVCGGNSILFDSDNIEQMSNSIEQVVTDGEKRSELISRGLEWSKRFTWDKTAMEVLNVIKSAL